MTKKGICTLANDTVYDQVVALLNSIQAILGTQVPVCVYPFDENIDRIAAEISKRPNVFLYSDIDSIKKWDEFMKQASPASIDRKYRIYGGHRRFCAFDGPFEEFIYMDADTLVMDSLDNVFKKLKEYDCVVYDFQFRRPDKVYNTESSKLLKVFPQETINSQIFCSGFYGSKCKLFPAEKRAWLLSKLKEGEAEILYRTGDQPVLNYMFMRSQKYIYNFVHHLPSREVTGNSVTSSHFQEQEHILYDKGMRLTYLHYIGVPPRVTEAVCKGQNIDFPYRNLFLHYRYLYEPEKKPVFTGVPVSYQQPPSKPSLLKRFSRKINSFLTARN